ncbi:MAG: type II secretion system F family protein [Planctomycetota bacterium]
MARYFFKAVTPDNKIVKDSIDSSTIEEAKENIRSKNLYLLEITEKRGISLEVRPQDIIFGTISKRDLALVTRQLAVLLYTGTPILKAIEIIIEQKEFRMLCKILSEIKNKLAQGISFSDALRNYSNVFGEVYINMVRSGEASGELPKVLIAISDHLIESEQLKGKIISALSYPLIVIGFSLIVVFVLFVKVIPNITSFLIEKKVPLPLPTRILIAISSFTQHYWIYILGVIATTVIIFLYLKTLKGFAVLVDRTVLKVPVVGNIVLKNSLTRFCKTLSMLLENGVPMSEAILVAGDVTKNSVLITVLQKIKKDVMEGMSVSLAMSKYKFLPRTLGFIVSVGEESGELPQLLKRLADGYKEELDILTQKFIAFLEPVLTLALSVFVIFVVLSIMLPIIDMLGTIK